MSRDYTKEVGLSSGDVIVPLRIAAPILAALAVVAAIGINAGFREQHARQHAPKAVTSVQTILR
jgi:hypothetical protein